jgi:hypothetical protein
MRKKTEGGTFYTNLKVPRISLFYLRFYGIFCWGM